MSTTGVRVLRVGMEGETPHVYKAWCSNWPHRLSRTEEDFTAHLGKVVKEMQNLFAPKAHSVVFMASDASNQQKLVQTAPMEDEDELEEFLISKKHYPDPENYLSDNLVLGSTVSEVKKSQDILVRTVSKQIAQTGMDALEQGGYELEGLEFAPNAIDAVYGLWFPESGLEQELVMHVSPEAVYLNFYWNGALRFGHTISLSQVNWLDMLFEKGQIEFDKSLKWLKGDLFASFFPAQNVYKLPEDLFLGFKAEFEWLVEEIYRSVSFYLCRVLEFQAPLLHRIILTGQEQRSSEFIELLRQRFGCSVEVFSILENMGVSADIQSRMAWDAWGSEVLLGMGLGTRYMEN